MKSANQNLRLPTSALIIAGLAVIFMVVWSVMQWPNMAAAVVTREAGGNHSQSVVPRWIGAAAMPALLAVLTALLAVTPALDEKLMKRILATPQQDRGRGAVRVLGASLVGLSFLLSALHVGFVSMYTDVALPIERIVPIAVGVMLAILGIYLPLARPSTTHNGEWVESFRAAQGPAFRIGGFVLVLVGIATAASGWALPWLSMGIAVGGVSAVFAGIAVVSFIRASRS